MHADSRLRVRRKIIFSIRNELILDGVAEIVDAGCMDLVDPVSDRQRFGRRPFDLDPEHFMLGIDAVIVVLPCAAPGDLVTFGDVGRIIEPCGMQALNERITFFNIHVCQTHDAFPFHLDRVAGIQGAGFIEVEFAEDTAVLGTAGCDAAVVSDRVILAVFLPDIFADIKIGAVKAGTIVMIEINLIALGSVGSPPAGPFTVFPVIIGDITVSDGILHAEITGGMVGVKGIHGKDPLPVRRWLRIGLCISRVGRKTGASKERSDCHREGKQPCGSTFYSVLKLHVLYLFL